MYAAYNVITAPKRLMLAYDTGHLYDAGAGGRRQRLAGRRAHRPQPIVGGTIAGEAPPFMALSIGTRLGPYEILSALGAGGMGEVYKARDTRLDLSVAIKILGAPDCCGLRWACPVRARGPHGRRVRPPSHLQHLRRRRRRRYALPRHAPPGRSDTGGAPGKGPAAD